MYDRILVATTEYLQTVQETQRHQPGRPVRSRADCAEKWCRCYPQSAISKARFRCRPDDVARVESYWPRTARAVDAAEEGG